MSGIQGMVVDYYYKGALAAGVAITASGLVASVLAVATIGIGIAIAAIGEWVQIRRISVPVQGGFGHGSGEYYQIARIPNVPGAVIEALGIIVALIGLAALIWKLFT